MSKDQATITIYQKPSCSTCREAIKLVAQSGRPYKTVNYYETPFSKGQLKALLKRAGLAAKDLLRSKEAIYRQLKLAARQVSDDELIDLMLKHPDLIQRPLAEKGDEVLLARPADTVKRLLKD
jgi:arsenate reductase